MGPTRFDALRPSRLLLGLLAAATGALAGCDLGTSTSLDTSGGTTIDDVGLEIVVENVSQPVYLTAPAEDPRLFIAERRGAVRVVDAGGSLLPTPFLDLSDQVRATGSEQGLLGMAFHPDYGENGRFFVSFTDTEGDSRIVEYSAEPESDVADPTSGSLILHVEQPYENHNGGQVSFGPDGYLYIGLGDGGLAGDPDDHAQDPHSLLGSILRIDVDGGTPYAIPASNPFVDGGGRPEVWAYGLRNPWRFAWDPVQNLMYIADVGQERWEEINIILSGSGGRNFGWAIMEGGECFLGGSCATDGLELPQIVYSHQVGCAITGGVVYRGAALPALVGQYLFGDFCLGWLRAAAVEDRLLVGVSELTIPPPGSITSFGMDAEGEVYVLVAEGRVLKFVPRS